MPHKESLLTRVIAQGYSQKEAKGLILGGRVRVAGQTESRLHAQVSPETEVKIIEKLKYPSRAACKLKGALEAWETERFTPNGRLCIDIGASHGGFTQVLLEHGARLVYAIDVAYGILDYGLRNDTRVRLLERKNFRHAKPDWFLEEDLELLTEAHGSPEALFVTCDVSFISLKTILCTLKGLLDELGVPMQGVFLLKPQFEDSAATKKGIVCDPDLSIKIRLQFEAACRALGFVVEDSREADLQGRHGNQEYVYRLRYDFDAKTSSFAAGQNED